MDVNQSRKILFEEENVEDDFRLSILFESFIAGFY